MLHKANRILFVDDLPGRLFAALAIEAAMAREAYVIAEKEPTEFEKRQAWLDSIRKKHQRRKK